MEIMRITLNPEGRRKYFNVTKITLKRACVSWKEGRGINIDVLKRCCFRITLNHEGRREYGNVTEITLKKRACVSWEGGRGINIDV